MTRHFISRSFLAALASVAIAGPAPALETVWETNPDLPTIFYESQAVRPCSTGPSAVGEAADDFNVIGTIDKLVMDGQQCQGCFNLAAVLDGFHVRFFEWTENGPGAMQAEYYIPKGDPNLELQYACCIRMVSISLAEPFQASGLHYFSTQAVLNGAGSWEIHPTNWGDSMAGEAYHRLNNGSWVPWSSVNGTPPIDLSFRLEGTINKIASPQILAVSGQPSIAPSARLRIDGLSFGASQNNRAVRIDGINCFITQWTDDTVIVYVPEAVSPGADRALEIIDTLTEEVLAARPITVAGRTIDDEHVNWRFAVDADFMLHRPGVAPDGSIYLNDYNHGRLYKLNPDGGLEWIVDALRGQIGLGGEGPVVIGDDGTVYVAVNPLGPTTDIVAYNPDGTMKWLFVEPHAFGVAVGPAIGPDGNLYVAFHDQDLQSFGITSFTPDGELRWNNNGNPPLYEHGALGAELVFGSSTFGGPVDQVVLTVDRDFDPYLYTFDMSDGSQNWNVPRGITRDLFLQFQIQPETGPDGTIYMTEFTGLGGLGWGLKAFNPANGSVLWRFDPDIISGASGPEVGSDGIIYFSWDISRVSAVFPNGTEKWRHVDFTGVRTQPTISDDNSVIMVGGGTFGVSGTFKTLNAQTGNELWRIQLPDENGNIVPDTRPLITADSATAYWPTVILADTPSFQYCYLYSIAITEPGTPGDVDGDGDVDFDDFTALLAAWGDPGCGGQSNCPADLDGDSDVDFDDFTTLLANWS